MQYQDSNTDRPTTSSAEFCKFKAMRAALAAKLSHAHFHVYAVMWDHASGDGRDIRPKLETIVKESGCSEKTVLAALKALIEAGLLERTFKGGLKGDRKMSSEYRLLLPAAAAGEVAGTEESRTPVLSTGERLYSVPDHQTSYQTKTKTLSTTAAPRIEDSSAEGGNGDRIPDAVLDAVQAYAGAPMNVDVIEGFEDVVAPVYGREVAEWITNSGVVHFEAGLSRYKAGARLRSALATARREGVGVLRFPAARNVVNLHSDESSQIRAEIAASLETAKRSAPVSGPETPVVASVDPEPVVVAPSPLQASAVMDSAPDPEDQIARMGEYVARWEAAQAEREAAAAREARWTATA